MHENNFEMEMKSNMFLLIHSMVMWIIQNCIAAIISIHTQAFVHYDSFLTHFEYILYSHNCIHLHEVDRLKVYSI